MFQQEKVEEENYRMTVMSGDYADQSSSQTQRKKIKKNDYFSDEEHLSE